MKRILIIFILSLTMVGCLGTKKTTEKSHEVKQTETTVSTFDSIQNKEINKEINDAVKILVNKSNTSDAEFNAAVDRAVDEILSKLNISKQSGSNSYKLEYDALKRELLLRTQVGQTESTDTNVNKNIYKEKTFSEKIDEYVFTKVNSIPWWVYVLVAVWFLPNILNKVKEITSFFRPTL